MRIDPNQKWHPVYLAQPIYNILLMLLFEWGVAVHDLDFEAIRKGEKSQEQVLKELKGIAGKARAQIVKDYIAWPFISGLVMTLVDAGVLSYEARSQNPARQAARAPPPRSHGVTADAVRALRCSSGSSSGARSVSRSSAPCRRTRSRT